MFILSGYIILPIVKKLQEKILNMPPDHRNRVTENKVVDTTNWRLLGDGNLEKTPFSYRSATIHRFLELITAMELIRVNRKSEIANGSDAGTSSDLNSFSLDKLSDDDFGKLVIFMEENPEVAKEALIKSGGFKDKKQSFWKRWNLKTK